MEKLKGLRGIANNLADSFVSPTNIEFIHKVRSMPPDDVRLIKIDLLKETITPGELIRTCKGVLSDYKKWFLKEIERLDIKLIDIQEIMIKVSYKPGSSFGSYFTCSTIIKSKDKEYTGKKLSSYS